MKDELETLKLLVIGYVAVSSHFLKKNAILHFWRLFSLVVIWEHINTGHLSDLYKPAARNYLAVKHEPTFSLLHSSYTVSWKSCLNHFLCYLFDRMLYELNIFRIGSGNILEEANRQQYHWTDSAICARIWRTSLVNLFRRIFNFFRLSLTSN